MNEARHAILLQRTTTLSTIIVPLVDAMPHKTRTLLSCHMSHVTQMVLPMGIKLKKYSHASIKYTRYLQDVVPFLSKLSVIKNQYKIYLEKI